MLTKLPQKFKQIMTKTEIQTNFHIASKWYIDSSIFVLFRGFLCLRTIIKMRLLSAYSRHWFYYLRNILVNPCWLPDQPFLYPVFGWLFWDVSIFLVLRGFVILKFILATIFFRLSLFRLLDTFSVSFDHLVRNDPMSCVFSRPGKGWTSPTAMLNSHKLSTCNVIKYFQSLLIQ